MKYLLVTLCLFSVVAIAWWLLSPSLPPAQSSGEDIEAYALSSPPPLATDSAQASPGSSHEIFYRELLTILGGYREHIATLATQLSLAQPRAFVLSVYPGTGQAMFYRAIRELYPELAEAIIDNLRKYDTYQQWLAEQASTFGDMDDASVKAAIWNKRVELFGEESRELWSEEVQAYEARRESARALIEELNTSDVLSNDEKLYQLKSAVDEVFEYSVQGFLVDRGVVSQLFLTIESVQRELSGLPPDRQQLRLSEMRREMGYSKEQISRMQELDNKRNQRWENGNSYMAERDKLAGELNGPELTTQLELLREKYFAHEARTIALEEEQGFFRYKRPRVIGIN